MSELSQYLQAAAHGAMILFAAALIYEIPDEKKRNRRFFVYGLILLTLFAGTLID
jgi:hypothetical protein